MKKQIILISVLLLLGAYSNAQKVKLGFQASPQLSWMKSSDSEIKSVNSGLGIKYGLEADIFISDIPRYCFNTGLYVSDLSYKTGYYSAGSLALGDKTLSTPTEVKFKLKYIEIPLDIKLRSDQFYRLTYYGQFGLTNLINIGATATSSDLVLEKTNVNESIRFYNMGMLVGAGAEYDVGGNTAINLGIQYTNYFLDATSIKNLNEKTTINAIRLVIGVMF